MSLRINGDRLWANLEDISKIGGTDKGGCNRQALTDLDMAGRAMFADWCTAIGMTISYDSAGNMFARLSGRDDELAPLVVGSHLDTQPTGGKYDGIYGVLAGLEVARRLVEEGASLSRPYEVAVWMNEEGARFAPAMMGSGVYAGVLPLDAVRQARDIDGISVGQELDRHGYSANPAAQDKEIHAYLELHIEQGPVLEEAECQVGVVTGAQGIRWYDLTLIGTETHAGPNPMHRRNDPMRAVPSVIDGVYEIGETDGDARSTIGVFNARPGSRNVVPGQLELTIDIRHPEEQTLLGMHQRLEDRIAEIGKAFPNLQLDLTQVWHSPVVRFDETLVESVRKGAQDLELSASDIVSGAGHDALMVARRAPTAMIFIPCEEGISHNEAENIEKQDAEAGANVLLAAVQRILGG